MAGDNFFQTDVVTHNNVILTSQDLKDLGQDKLTGYKTPRIYEFRNKFPMSSVGKMLKRNLNDESSSLNGLHIQLAFAKTLE